MSQTKMLSVQTASLATDATVATIIRTEGHTTWAEIPTFAVGVITATGQVYCAVANTTTAGAFRRVVDDKTANGDFWTTTSSIGNFYVKLPNRGWDYTRLELNNTASVTFNPVLHVVGEGG